VVLFVGRFIEKKGIFELLDAARALPDYEFWLAGNGNVRIPPLSNVKVLGFQEDIVPLYAASSVCAFPFHHDNFPLVGLEAMACGKAIVATEPGFSEYVESGKDGMLVQPHDVQALIDSIRYLMRDDKARRRLGENGRKKARQYDWSVVAKGYENLYDTLL
jgi:glycosyltransferase involved in cell wall biosynthesis